VTCHDGGDALSSQQQPTDSNDKNSPALGMQFAAMGSALRRWRSGTSASEQQRIDGGGGRSTPLIATFAAFGLLGLVYVLNELLPGPGGAQRFYDRGVQYYETHDYKSAKEQFGRAISVNPNFKEAYFQRALVHQRVGEIDDAIADYTGFLRLKPDDWAAFYNRGLAYRSRGDRERALADFTEAERLKPDDTRSVLRRVEIYRAAGDFGQALSLLGSLIDRYGNNLDYRYARAELRREIGDLDGALRDLDAVVAITDRHAFEPYVKRGRLRRETGDIADALADFEAAIARKPDDLQAYLERGQTYRDTGRLDAARTEFDAAIARKADLATGYLYRGATRLFMTGDAAAAAEDLSVALDKGFAYAAARRLGDIGIRSLQKKLGVPVTAGDDEGDALAPGVPFRPSIYYAIIWRHLARLHAGQDDAEEFAKATQRLEMELWREAGRGPPIFVDDRVIRAHWPGEVLALFAGRTTPEQVRRAAETAQGAHARRLRLCEADFYIAEYNLAKSKRAEALILLQAVADGCPAGAPEAAFAKAALARLKASG
jgi:tetratricopeptide (TPR) repeat protein